MTSDDIRLVQESWHKIEFVQEIAADLFFGKLFELDPALRANFDGDVRSGRQKFASILGATVRGLDRVAVLLPAIRALGIRHPAFAGSDFHQANVAQALLWALEKGLRNDFTPQVKSAWIATYGVLSQTMREGAGPLPAPGAQAAA